MGLYLDQIFNSKVGIINLNIPDPSGNGTFTSIDGFLSENPSMSFQNNWGSIFPDFNALGEMSQLMGSKNIFSWLASTQAGWKGTEPINIGTEFYVISYDSKASKNIKEQVKVLIKMASLYQGTGLLENESVMVHGGYSNNYWKSTGEFFQNEEDFKSDLTSTKTGLITMTIGNQMTIKKLLLSDVNVTPSTVQVASGIPLYIKVSANFRTYMAPIASDIDDIFG